MNRYNQFAVVGALLLALSLIGYAVYELVLYPAAGFPTTDYAVVVGGASTLRVGHWLKFGYATSIALLIVGLYPRLREKTPLLAHLSSIAGVSAVTLFIASGYLGLRILRIATETFATDQAQAVTTILLRSVTIALLEAATFFSGAYLFLTGLSSLQAATFPRLLSLVGVIIGALHIFDAALPDELRLIAPILTIAWLVWLIITLSRRPSPTAVQELSSLPH